ncbi:MAG TPA: hypothetical protein VMA83_06225 [Solirubrobacteraceae bacterium]|nr:hypothetical protein [Solirubrobacteraceae bacterium]
MQPARQILLTTLAGAALLAASATTAAAATDLYVARDGSDSEPCTSAAKPCMTIARALEVAREDHGKATIYVAQGTYSENVDLDSARDDGDAIIGAGNEETVLENEGAHATVSVSGAIAVRLEYLTIRHDTADSNAAVSAEGARLALRYSDVSASGANGESAVADANAPAGSPLTVAGCKIRQGGEDGAAVAAPGTAVDVSTSTLETTGAGDEAIAGANAAVTVEGSALVTRGSEDEALRANLAAVTLDDSTIEALGTRGDGLSLVRGSLAARGTRLVEAGREAAAVDSEGARIALEGDTFEADENGDSALLAQGGNATLTADIVAMNAPADAAAALQHESGGYTTLRKVRVRGSWNGAALTARATGRLSILESSLIDTAGLAGTPTVVADTAQPGGLAVLVERSRIAAAPTASAALDFDAAGAFAMDSSLVQGGDAGISLAAPAAEHDVGVIAGSTIDAGEFGVEREGAVASVAASAGPASSLNVAVEGSILFEPLAATHTEGGGGSTVACRNSDTPSQRQVASATEGAVGCRAGAHGNHNLPALGSLFSSIGGYELRRHTTAVDSVPAYTVALPLVRPARLDLDGRKRDLYARVGRKCLLVQDRGALQIAGQRADCKPGRPRRGRGVRRRTRVRR